MIHARRGSLIKGSRTELEVNLNAKRIITLLMAAVMAMALLGCLLELRNRGYGLNHKRYSGS